MIQTTEDNSWKEIYGSICIPNKITPSNGDILFLDNQISIDLSTDVIKIPYHQINSLNLLSVNFGLSKMIRISTKNNEKYVLIIPNPTFYIKKLLERAPQANLEKTIHTTIPMKIVRLIFGILVFSAVFFLPKLIHKDPFVNSAQVISLSVVLLVAANLYLTLVIHKNSKWIPSHSKFKLIISTWVVPVIGLAITEQYLTKFSFGQSGSSIKSEALFSKATNIPKKNSPRIFWLTSIISIALYFPLLKNINNVSSVPAGLIYYDRSFYIFYILAVVICGIGLLLFFKRNRESKKPIDQILAYSLFDIAVILSGLIPAIVKLSPGLLLIPTTLAILFFFITYPREIGIRPH